ncbi:transposable element Tcb2 transposase [Trichonephila clavipes]|nr:transposable element Tcb2 transposase [Trichonephila clavipes]
MFRPLSNSLNCEKCLLARLPGMFRLPKSSYNRRVIITFRNLRTCAGLYSTLFLIVAPPRHKLLGAVDTRRYPRAEKLVWSNQGHEERGSKDHAASTCGSHSDLFNDASRRRVAIIPQTISRHLAEANLKSKCPFRALTLTPEHRQLRLQWWQARLIHNVPDWQKVVFSEESRFVLGTDDNRVRVGKRPARVAQDFLRHFQTLPWPARSPICPPVEHVWDQLKLQMPSCHSVHDLQLAIQDVWAHLPQDIIRCLINSMPDHVAACIAAGSDPTRY